MGWLLALIVVLALAWVVGLRAMKRRPAATPISPPPPGWFPSTYDLDNPAHVLLIDDIRAQYAAALAETGGEFAGLAYKPASLLPHPRAEIRKALTALLAYAHGRRSSRHLHPRLRASAVVDTLEASLLQLETFLDVPAAEIPREPRANVEYGFRHVRRDERHT